jgi:hypothetical protein
MGRAPFSTTKSKWSTTGPNRSLCGETPATTIWTKTQLWLKGYFVSISVPPYKCGIRHLDWPRPVQFSRCLLQNYPATGSYVIYHSVHTATAQTKQPSSSWLSTSCYLAVGLTFCQIHRLTFVLIYIATTGTFRTDWNILNGAVPSQSSRIYR